MLALRGGKTRHQDADDFMQPTSGEAYVRVRLVAMRRCAPHDGYVPQALSVWLIAAMRLRSWPNSRQPSRTAARLSERSP